MALKCRDERGFDDLWEILRCEFMIFSCIYSMLVVAKRQEGRGLGLDLTCDVDVCR